MHYPFDCLKVTVTPSWEFGQSVLVKMSVYFFLCRVNIFLVYYLLPKSRRIRVSIEHTSYGSLINLLLANSSFSRILKAFSCAIELSRSLNKLLSLKVS
jgi:hypothetical protein